MTGDVGQQLTQVNQGIFMDNTLSNIEQRAICEHVHTSKEVMCGQKTGDRICDDCGECVVPGTVDPPVAFRDDYIVTTRELSIVMSIEKAAELKFYFRPEKSVILYPCALVSLNGSLIKPVFKSVAESYLKHVNG